MKRIKDERIIRESNRIVAPMYFLAMFLLIVSIIVKLQLTQDIGMYLLDLIVLTITLLYLVIGYALKGVLFQKSIDEAIIELKNQVKANCFLICLSLIVIGQLVLMLLHPNMIGIVLFYLPVWFIPSIIITTKTINKGLFIWGSAKSEKVGINKLKIIVPIAALFYGIFMGRPYLVVDSKFNLLGLIYVFVMAAIWGIPFYFLIKLIIKKSEKKAENELIEIEKLNGDNDEE